jgi:hypothetical protein
MSIKITETIERDCCEREDLKEYEGRDSPIRQLPPAKADSFLAQFPMKNFIFVNTVGNFGIMKNIRMRQGVLIRDCKY